MRAFLYIRGPTLRVVFLCWPLHNSGGHRVILRQAEGLQAAGHDVRIVIVEGSPLHTPSTSVPIEVVSRRPHLDGTGSEWLMWASVARGRAQTWKRVPPCDAVIGTWFPTVYLARSVGRHTGATPLWLLQDFPEMFHLRLTKRALGRAASAVHGIIADSHYLLDKVVAPAAGQPVHVICPGVEEAFFAAPARARPPFDRPKELRTLWLGNPAPYKGYRVYAQAVAALRGQGWDVKSTLVGPASLRALDTVGSRLLTDLSDGQLAQLYTEHDVCISTSTREGFGLPPLESMAAGTPAVLVDSGGPRDYARDGENCFVVPEANAEFIAASVRKLANDPGLVDRLRMAGRQTAERFHWAQLQQDFAKAVAAMARPRG